MTTIRDEEYKKILRGENSGRKNCSFRKPVRAIGPEILP